MAYEKYKKIISKKQFYDEWDNGTVDALNSELKQYVYDKYVLKCKVFTRDSFTCQGRIKQEDEKTGQEKIKGCPYCQNKLEPKNLTMHHVKFRKNGGENKKRNMVTLCKGIHTAFHRGKTDISFPDIKHLPKHIAGHTFKLTPEEKFEWKELRQDVKAIKKEIKQKLGDKRVWLENGRTHWFALTVEQIMVLMRFLSMPYDQMDMEDDD